MVLYEITLVPVAEEFQASPLGILPLFYADDEAFDGSARRSAWMLKLLLVQRIYVQVPIHRIYIDR